MQKLVLLVLLSLLFQGSQASAPDDPEWLERSLAAANMQGFSEKMLLHAIFPDYDTEKPRLSKEEIFKAMASPEGQEAARGAAMRSMLSRSRARGADGWLGGMCDAMPWLSWLVQCAESDEQHGPENREEPTEPNTLVIMDYEWASCEQEGDYEEDNAIGF